MLGALIGGLVSGGLGLLGSKMSNDAAEDAAEQAFEYQKQILQKQVQWRVKDAIKAGLHPLAALGVNPASGPPPAQVDMNLGSTLAGAGQDIGRALEAGISASDQASIHMAQLQVENQNLQNDLLRTQIASQRMRNVQTGTPGIYSSPTERLLNPATGETWPVKYPDLGQTAENHYSDIGGFVFGGGSMVADWMRNNGMDPKAAWDDPTGYVAMMLRKTTTDAWQKNIAAPGENPYAENMQWGF